MSISLRTYGNDIAGYACCIVPVTIEHSSEARSETGKWMTEMVGTTRTHSMYARAQKTSYILLYPSYGMKASAGAYRGTVETVSRIPGRHQPHPVSSAMIYNDGNANSHGGLVGHRRVERQMTRPSLGFQATWAFKAARRWLTRGTSEIVSLPIAVVNAAHQSFQRENPFQEGDLGRYPSKTHPGKQNCSAGKDDF
ncbi:hypothetical protein EDD16DRAFT_1516120 [Pisolithus croceorrhizus]|nr:hypothetical protein EDD16DRAFT_1516120 [Pisolithus croceorrhizus]KAI6133943.1 hypothetical protein EV401DRAFT_1883109 [Pisolithus croceorrhizus]KAI6162892.1 hypothetical protein EDD17DRAFT_1507746 [Pisolithus thermaeus]